MGSQSRDGGVLAVQRADLLASFWTRKRPMSERALILRVRLGSKDDLIGLVRRRF